MPAALDLSHPAAGIVRPGSARARARNQRIRAVVRPDTLEKLPFFCECGTEQCQSNVWLTLQEVRDAINSGEPIIGDHLALIRAR